MGRPNRSGALSTLAFTLGVLLLAYPFLARAVQERLGSRLISQYENVGGGLTQAEIEEELGKARDFNRALAKEPARWELPRGLKETYYRTLDLSGTGILGTLSIPSIGVRVPVYHGDADTVLQVAAGHMEGSSFPTGEPGTHGAIAAHTGMASAELFTELDCLSEGDWFSLHMAGEPVAFQVVSVQVVEPGDMEPLEIDPERGLLTLVTCTPLGVNTHRLLVTGECREAPRGALETRQEPALTRDLALAGCAVLACAVFIRLALPACRKRKTRKKNGKENLDHGIQNQ